MRTVSLAASDRILPLLTGSEAISGVCLRQLDELGQEQRQFGGAGLWLPPPLINVAEQLEDTMSQALNPAP